MAVSYDDDSTCTFYYDGCVDLSDMDENICTYTETSYTG